MATDLGKVGMVMKGDWDSSTAYEVLDAVSYDGGLYIAKQAVPANTLPTNTTYWQASVTEVKSKIIQNVEFSSGWGTIYKGSATIPTNGRVIHADGGTRWCVVREQGTTIRLFGFNTSSGSVIGLNETIDVTLYYI